MENKDRVSEILSDNGGLEPEMLEKLSESCDVLSDEQKNRIFDIIQAKENGTEQINSENEKNEETVRVIEYRKTNNTVKIIAAVAACACIVTGLIFFSGKNDENLIPGDDSAKTTTVYETAKFAEISEGADSFVTSEQMPAVTVIETVISAEEVTGIVKPAETAPVAEAGEQVTEKTSETTAPEATEAVSETEKVKELRNLKDEMLAQTWGEGGAYDIVTGAMRDAGFNEDQIYIMKNTAMFTRFADELDGLNHSIELDSSSYGNTGFSYESFRELIGMFFTDDAQQLYYAGSSGVLEARSPEHIFDASDNDGELRLQFGTPVRPM